MRLLKRSVSILLTLTMMLGILAVIPLQASAASSISYVYRYWDSAKKKVVDTVKACNDYTALDNRSGDYLQGWYVVNHNMTINSRLYVDDDDPVNIILCDGATLTCPKGIQISYYSRLNIYGQSGDSGKLVIHPESSSESPGNSHALIEANGVFNFYGGTLEAKCGAGLTHFDGAAIGGAKGKMPGTVSFYGGKVHARTYFNGAAIGGGYQGGTGTVRFYGGGVYAEGTSSPGIGNGPEGNSDGSIEIYEGTVDSVTHNFSAGIGGADGTDGPAITISGGNVYGCNTHDTRGGAGIGSGYNANRTKPIRISGGFVQGRGWSGAGIGSGALADVSRIDITGGVIIGESERGGAGIGGGYKGDAGTISISNACVNASSKSFKDSDEYAEVMNAWINRINMNSITSKDAGIAAGAMYLLLTGVRELGLAFADSEGGCAVGGGYNGSFDTINISNCPSFVANGAKYCAAIGSGDEAKHCGTINITDSTVEAYAGSDAAAIGTGNEAEETATINITGSTITAHGGRLAAGIGGGDDVSGGTINITNSTIKEAKSETDGAGIGGGEDGHGGNITIKNSNVIAHGGGYGAGIGGGDEGDGGIIKIDHSTVKAYGGTDAAGIGGGENGDGGKIYITNGSNVYARGLVCGAGIGGGEDSSGEYCHIGIGCTVEAQAGGYLNAQAIGHGECGWYVDSYTGGTLSLEQSSVVFAGNKRYYGKDRFEAIWRSNYVLISPCNHKVSTDYRYDTPGYHVKYCTLCGTRIGDTQEAHVWDSHNECTKCHASATMLDVYFITRDKNNKEITETKKIPHQSMYILPECENIPDGYDFLYWEVDSSPYFLPGEEVRIHGGDTKIRAVYLPVVETEYVDAYGNLNKTKARRIDTPKNLNLKAASLMLPEGWYVVDSDITFAHQNIIFTKNVNLIIADGKTLKFDQYENKRWEEIEYCSIYPAKSFSDAGDFTIYGQSKQTGTVDIGYRYAFIPNLVINGGIFKCEPVKSRKATSTTYTLTINRGQLKRYCFSCEKGTGWVDEDLFTMTGGNIELSELAVRGNLKLGWSSLTDSIKIDDYSRGNIRIADGQSLKDENGKVYSGALSDSQVNAIKGKTLTPYLEHSYNAPEWKWDNEYRDATAVFRCKDCADVQEIKAKATHEDSGNNRKVTARCTFLGQEYQTTQTFRIIFDVTVAKTQNGKVTANKQTAMISDSVKLVVTPDDGYVLSEMYYTDTKGKKTVIEGSSFVMPESSVTVYAVFEAALPEHTHTYNSEPVWKWSDDHNSAEATFTCTVKNCGQTETVQATVTKKYENGNMVYTASAVMEGKTYTDTYSEAHTHTYSDEPVWKWSDDHLSAQLIFPCTTEGCDEGLSHDATVATYSEGEKYIYTAIVYVNGKLYSTTYSVDHIHTYGEPEWKWSEDFSSAKANFYCTKQGCGNYETVNAAVTAKHETGKLTFSAVTQFEGKTYTDKKELSCQYFARKEPYIDEKGEYIIGNVEYYVIDGKNYSVDLGKSVVREIDNVSLSYFDFMLWGSTYVVSHYTGSYDLLENDELVIPKSFNGKKITRIGPYDSYHHAVFMNAGGTKKNFTLVLNENITDIGVYAFADTTVTKVIGDTSSLRYIGWKAFAWEPESPKSMPLDIKLDHSGTIDTDRFAFEHRDVTIRMKHSAAITKDKEWGWWEKSEKYIFTDAHTYGEPVWDWNLEDFSGANVTRTCTHPNCKHTESVLADFVETTEEDGIPFIEAVAIFDDAEYHDVKPVYTTEAGGYIVEVTGRFKGQIDAGKHNMVGKDGFRVVFKDKDGNKVDAPQYIWVAQETASDGIVVDPNGDAAFTKEGEFHVQLRSPDGETIYSQWIPVRSFWGSNDEYKDSDKSSDDTSSQVIGPKDDMPRTGDSAPTAIAVILLTSLSAALFLSLKRRKNEDET